MLTLELNLILILVFGAVVTFVAVGIDLFARGWESYEEKYVAGAQRTLEAMYLTIPPQHLIYLSFLSCVLVGGIAWAVFPNAVFDTGCAIVAFPIPRLAIVWLKRRRDKKFNVQLIDALNAMGNALKAGFSLPQALEMLQREMDNPMGQEMRLVCQELRLGVQLDDALQHMLNRMPSQDLELIVTSIAISREVGGQLSEVFDNIADTIRERFRIEGRIQALTAQGKLQGIVISMLPVLVGLALNAINPALFRPMYTTLPGWVLMGIIAIMELMGIYFIWRIVSIEV